MARLEDGVFTQAYVTVGTDIDATYKIWDDTHTLTVEEAAIMGKKLIKGPLESVYTMQETTSIPEAEVSGYDVISHPDHVGKAKRIYTNSVGGTGGTTVKFKLLDDTTVDIVCYAGTWLPIATKGCNRAGILVVA